MGASGSIHGGMEDYGRCQGCGRMSYNISTTYEQNLCQHCIHLGYHDQQLISLHHSEVAHRQLVSAVNVLRLIESHLHHEILVLQASILLQNEQTMVSIVHKRETIIKNLKHIQTHQHDVLFDKVCAICVTDFPNDITTTTSTTTTTPCGAGDCECSIVQLPCLHIFHTACIQEWFQKKLICPVCRFALDLTEIPTILELEKLTRHELLQRLSYYNHENEYYLCHGMTSTISELSRVLHTVLVARKKVFDDECEAFQVNELRDSDQVAAMPARRLTVNRDERVMGQLRDDDEL
jgi:hypothetical protein